MITIDRKLVLQNLLMERKAEFDQKIARNDNLSRQEKLAHWYALLDICDRNAKELVGIEKVESRRKADAEAMRDRELMLRMRKRGAA